MINTVLTSEELFCLQGCRKYKQYYNMRKRFEAGECTFCNIDRNFNRVAWEDQNAIAWFVPKDYKRDELRHHILVIPKRHVRFEADLEDSEVLSIHAAKRYLCALAKYQGGLTHVREGDMRLNAGTVPHLHYNIFEPNGTGEVRVPVYKDQGKTDDNIARAAAFAKRYEGGEVPK